MEKSNNIDSHKKPNAGNSEGERNFYHLKFLNLRCLEFLDTFYLAHLQPPQILQG